MTTGRAAPRWTESDAAWFGAEGHCVRCGALLRVGESYWLDSATMIREPPRVFHDLCPQAVIRWVMK